ncbi:MAG: hypothetical protein LGB72_02370 [Sulfurovum sp.]|nr:hypothetical protein [Sulfurovum sp.]MCB4777048.1 hypothetical protein [Sulfurovum sp.]
MKMRFKVLTALLIVLLLNMLYGVVTQIMSQKTTLSPEKHKVVLKKHIQKPMIMKKKTEKKTEKKHTKDGNNTIHIIIPKPPKVPIPVKVSTKNANGLDSHVIKFSKRVPPGYIPPEKRTDSTTKPTDSTATKLVDNDIATNKIGEVDNGRISTYLRAPFMNVDKVKKILKGSGFRIIAVAPLDKKKELTTIVFTNDMLEKFAVENSTEFLASLRLLVNKKDNRISITNPLYMAQAFTQKKYDKNIPIAILKKIKANFKGLINSKDKLKYQMLSNYQFMIGMPRYEDMIEVAMGGNLLKNIQGKSQVVFQQKLPNGAILFGMQFREPTQKFPYQIGTNNAVLLPYPVLIKEKKAYIMNPKYYISIMYPLLKMSQFMAISTIPGAILKEAQSVFRKGR